jgi:hypothetical protein
MGLFVSSRFWRLSKMTASPQIEALEAAGCQRVYEEHISCGRWDRPELHRLLDRLGPDNVLTVWNFSIRASPFSVSSSSPSLCKPMSGVRPCPQGPNFSPRSALGLVPQRFVWKLAERRVSS